jgi:acyl-CoA thioesterase-1
MVSFLSRIFVIFTVVYGLSLSYAQAQETTTVLIFGDSIVAGYGLNENESVPIYLERALKKNTPGIKIINGGVSGDTTSGGRSRLAWTLDKHKPDFALIALGGNDVLRGVPPQTTKENILAMLELLKERKIPSVLSAVQAPGNLGVQYKTEFDNIFTDAAKTYNLPLYPFLLSETFGKNELMQADGIHPNAQGAEIIATSLAEYLQELPAFRELTERKNPQK